MDNDKILFQRASQGLIIYDNENRDAYRKGWYDIEYCPKGFCAHRIILCVILGLNILTVMVSRIIAVDMNFILAVICLLLYKRYRKKAKLKKEALENRSEILNNDRRKRYIDTLNQLSAKHPEWNVEPWWNTVCGLELDIGGWYHYDLHYFVDPLIGKDKNGRRFLQGNEDEYMTLTNGTYINQLIQSGKFKRLIIKPTAYEDLTEYSIAGLYMYEQEENWETKAYSAYTSHEVDEMMDSYRDELDEKERKRNFWSESGYYETDKEKYSRRQMYAKGLYDVSDDLNDTFERQRKERKREEKIRNTKEYEKYLDSLEYSFYFVGYLISNKDCLSEVLINKEYSIYTRYRTSVSQLGESCFIQKEYDLDEDIANRSIPSTVILSKLRFLKLGNMDYTSKRPDYLTLDEWAAWIYAHTS